MDVSESERRSKEATTCRNDPPNLRPQKGYVSGRTLNAVPQHVDTETSFIQTSRDLWSAS